MAIPPLEIRVSADTASAEAGLKRVGIATREVGETSQRSSRGIQNIALQLNQVGQQAAVTGNVFQALSIQLPDMLAGFGGLAPAIAGAALGLGAAFIPHLLQTKDATDQVGKSLEAMNDQMGAFNKLVKDGKTPLDELVQKFGSFADEIQRATPVAQNAALSDLIDRFDETKEAIAGPLQRFNDLKKMFADLIQKEIELGSKTQANAEFFETLQKTMGDVAMQMRLAANEMGLSVSQASALGSAMSALEGAEGPKQIADAASNALEAIEKMGFDLGEMPEQIRPLVLALREVQTDTAQVTTELGQTGENAGGAASNVDILTSNLTLAKEQAKLLKEEMEAIATFEQAGKGLSAMDLYGDFIAYQESRLAAPDEPVKRFAKQVKKSKFDVKDAFGGMFDELDKIEKKSGDAFTSMANNFKAGTEKMTRIGQAFAATETLLNAYRAYNQTIADPSLPWFAKLAAGASVLAAGLNAVNAVKSIGGGGGGGSVGGGIPSTSTTTAPAPAPLDVRVAGLGASDLISGAALSDLFDRLQDEAGDRGFTVSFAT